MFFEAVIRLVPHAGDAALCVFGVGLFFVCLVMMVTFLSGKNDVLF